MTTKYKRVAKPSEIFKGKSSSLLKILAANVSLVFRKNFSFNVCFQLKNIFHKDDAFGEI